MAKLFSFSWKAAIVVFVLILGFTLVSGIRGRHRTSELVEDMEKTVVVRYYLGDGDDAVLHYQRVERNKSFTLEIMPSKDGKIFAGLYSGKDWESSTLYVNSDGESVLTLQKDVLLYPVFS